METKKTPWDSLEPYRGEKFTGECPTLPELFEITASRFPSNKCFTEFLPTERSWNYKDALHEVQKVASWLIENGIKIGDRVAMTGKNSIEWVFSYLGALYAGAVVVPIDYQLTSTEIEGLLSHSETKILFVDEEKIDSIDIAKTKLKKIVSLAPKHDCYILDFNTEPLKTPVFVSENDLAAILYTSGTTGTAKGVMLSHKNFISDCFDGFNLMPIYPTDVFYALLPIHHSYTMLAVFIVAISTGAELVFGKKLAMPSIMVDLKKGNVTMFLGVPALYNKLIHGILKKLREKGILVYGLIRGLMGLTGFVKAVFHVNIGKFLFKGILKKAALDTLRICISGGGPLPSSTFKHFNELGIDFVQGYGLTETAPILTLNPVEHYKNASVGKVLSTIDMRILDPDKEGRGEIIVKGPMVMLGYYKNEEETRNAFTDDGFFKTGDIGYLDKENYLFLTGRAKSLIVTDGGKNVFPEEIENKFQLFSDVEQILVRGFEKDSALKIEGIEAIIYPDESIRKSDLSKEAIHAHFQEIVDKVNRDSLIYKRVQRLVVLDEPMEMTSKRTIKRHKLSF